MSKLDLLRKLNKTLSPNKVDFSAVENEVNALKKKLEETVNIQTVDDVKYQLEKFQKKINFSPILQEIDKISEIFKERVAEFQSLINEKAAELESIKKSVVVDKTKNIARALELKKEIASLTNELDQFTVVHEQDIEALKKSVEEISLLKRELNDTFSKLSSDIDSRFTKSERSLEETQKSVEDLRREILERISRIGGGNANRQINVNSSVMSTQYTDINFQQFGNIGWSTNVDSTNRRINIRASILVGGGGAGSGIARSVSVLSVSSTLASATSTDYVFFPNVGIQLTLPTAISNSNLYTVKNIATSSVRVVAATGEDIDGSSAVLMPTQYESLSFISNGSVFGVI